MSETAFRLLLVWEIIPLSVMILLMAVDIVDTPAVPVSRLKLLWLRAFAALLMAVSTIGIEGNLYWAIWGGLNG